MDSDVARRILRQNLRQMKEDAAENKRRRASLRRETDASHQVLEARVVAQVIPLRFDFQKSHERISLLEPSLQPGEPLVALAEAVINQCNVVRPNVTLS